MFKSVYKFINKTPYLVLILEEQKQKSSHEIDHNCLIIFVENRGVEPLTFRLPV
jgi:hypothetical protein